MLDELVLVVPPRHVRAKRRDIAPKSLAAEPLLVREEGSATRSVTERVLQRAGVRFRVAMELDHTEAIKQGGMAGLGVAFLSNYRGGGEKTTARLRALRHRGIRVQRPFHAIPHPGPRGTARP